MFRNLFSRFKAQWWRVVIEKIFNKLFFLLTFGHRDVGWVVSDLIAIFTIGIVTNIARMHVWLWIPSSSIQTSRTVMICVWVWWWCSMIVSVVQWWWVVCIDAWKMWIFVIWIVVIKIVMVMWMNMRIIARKWVRDKRIRVSGSFRFSGLRYLWWKVWLLWTVCVNRSGRNCILRLRVTSWLRVSVACGISCGVIVFDCVKIVGRLARRMSIWTGIRIRAGTTNGCCWGITWRTAATSIGWVCTRSWCRNEYWCNWSSWLISWRERTLRWPRRWKVCVSVFISWI